MRIGQNREVAHPVQEHVELRTIVELSMTKSRSSFGVPAGTVHGTESAGPPSPGLLSNVLGQPLDERGGGLAMLGEEVDQAGLQEQAARDGRKTAGEAL